MSLQLLEEHAAKYIYIDVGFWMTLDQLMCALIQPTPLHGCHSWNEWPRWQKGWWLHGRIHIFGARAIEVGGVAIEGIDVDGQLCISVLRRKRGGQCHGYTIT